MAGEIITIQVGQCGNQVGKQFWSQLCREHGIEFDGQSKVKDDPSMTRTDDPNPFFKQNDRNRYTPRAIMLDLEPSAVQDVQSNFPDFFDNRNVWISPEELGAGNSWSKGYDHGYARQEDFLNMIDKEIDATENFEGFQLIHSVAGGTGSGLGSSLLEAISDRYHKKFLTSYSVFPSDESEVVIQPYNTVLTMKRLAENSDASIVFDNNALLNLTTRVFRDPYTSYLHTNQLISAAMSSITNSIRFPNYMYNSLPSIFSALVPAPELHFLTSSFTPFTSDYVTGGKEFKSNTAYDVLLDLFDTTNFLVTRNTDNPIYFNIYCSLIGQAEQNDILRAISKAQQRLTFAPWSSSSLHVNVGRRSPYLPPHARHTYYNGLMLSNTSAITSLLGGTCKTFDKIFSKGAFLNTFKDGRMFQNGWDEFTESREVVQNVIEEYLAAEQETYLDDVLIEDENMVGHQDMQLDAEGDDII
ncbi:TUB4 (YLR212C) [Zygosaccharomyces parabailii]|uniref:Tubulin gamma chain n=1 Tax=Zygosaccharomyces bailii (strain CLIB 213 / ATCC 58445 / CBS 680 / BCRC 21525 / NBRC 1098 / NCYC 1416 / NRRL Y-2227) TaxID=1333698 RepID=A0A8J2TA75_ZYGB2|nr:TUB4 (YLR212C) [Zygosaccharomyces parabailii]CDF91260.1 ZYBA0S10-03290g1_1 [Zygosaccharomyces bailii CLIB 213]